MEALRAPLDAIRTRLNRRIALQRAVPESEVDVKAVRTFWSSLPTEVRLEVLRFTDSTVVQRVHDYMIKLLKADIWSRMNDVSTGDEPAPRLEGFEFEAPAERDCMGSLRAPIAIMATEELAANDQLLETMEELLGSPLLNGRPALQHRDWSTVFDVSPSSWEELQQQLYRLVELAIFHAERDPYYQLLRDAPVPPMRRRRKAKRPAKKESTAISAADQTASAEQNQKVSQNTAATSMNATAEMTEEDNKLGDEEGESDNPDQEIAEDAACLEQPAQLRPMAGSAEMACRPRLRLSSEEATCFRWLPDIFQDGSHFQLMQYRSRDAAEAKIPVARAYVRNTFVEVEVLDEHDVTPKLRRSASETFEMTKQ